MKAKEILAANKELFEQIAHALAKKGVLTYSDVQEIKKGCTVVQVGI